MKTCTKCDESKPPESFGKDIRQRSGLKSRCRECETRASYEYRRNNPAHYAAIQKRYLSSDKRKKAKKKSYRKNIETVLAKVKAYRMENVEVIRERAKTYREKNPDYWKAGEAKRQEKKRLATQFKILGDDGTDWITE